MGQGRIRGHLGQQVYTYDAYTYLVLSVPLLFECETEATPEEPLLVVRSASIEEQPGGGAEDDVAETNRVPSTEYSARRND